MVLVDTSVWVAHFRDGSPGLAALLNDGRVMCHPLIVGELACGNLKDRAVILTHLQLLPMSTEAEHHEVLAFIENHHLMGKGLGYVDMHLLASAALTGVPLWTFDKKLAQASDILGIKFTSPKNPS
ncbi:type II toxin-antitoxin system VapC family toxin [Desulfosudis oleivorans]|uniref:Ribonuclease VapC n=1 Tax=Desulfosudis oleivorans (strain DSM 6200 / JCM 39069 / Hxd3) TaxID=96561 RepID=A8ZTF7_DESOH|nr:type II toxin-antitoxin system VapC family toxin [Desulfosudis oleivorans]ABW66221.1 PilT protein domain protein [Desulfosudis oleivorans Hxd3]